MKRLCFIVLVVVGLLQSKLTAIDIPTHHDVERYINEHGYTDDWTKWHMGASIVLTGLVQWDWAWRQAAKIGIKEPTAWQKVIGLNVIYIGWELMELREQTNFDLKAYNDFYGGYALENNLFDVLIENFITIWWMKDDLFWQIKYIGKNGIMIGVTWEC